MIYATIVGPEGVGASEMVADFVSSAHRKDSRSGLQASAEQIWRKSDMAK
jgi:hypothetical protein